MNVDTTDLFDNLSQWNYSVMTWVNGTSYPGHIDTNPLGMDLVILLLIGQFVLLFILVYYHIRYKGV